MNWDDIKIFLAMVRHGTVRASAEALDISHSTVARRIVSLEKRLGARLFDRLSSGYRLTAAGQTILVTAENMEREVQSLERRVLGGDQKLSGHVRVATTDFLATHLLIPELPAYIGQYPGISVEVVTAYRSHDLDRREADIALRITNTPPSHLVGKRLGCVAFAPFATREYVRRHDLQARDPVWIGYERPTGSQVPQWVQDSAFPHLAVWGVFESLLSQMAAARAGVGIAMLPCLLGDSDPALQRLATNEHTPRLPLWLLTHRDVRTTARLRTLMQFIGKIVADNRPLLEGRAAVA